MKKRESRGLLFLGLELQERRKKLDGSSSPRFLLLLSLFSTSKNPFARARAGHEGLRDRSDARELAASTQFSVDDINEPICLYKDNEQEEVDPNALERDLESDEEEEYGTWRKESEGFHLCRPRVRLPVHDRDCLPVHVGRPGDRDRLPDHASSSIFPFFLTTRGKIDLGSASRYITTLVHAHIPGPVDAWREFPVPVWDLLFDMFTPTRPGG
ncbi:hypothetical protein Taro_029832 [Colocasia esculenta]|uniref:Uncharacterized protein n=1 Tax=Colocasia esculenta TaxID=4460 RepID=A0A843VW25_COLES|nr:hypothetical protein [Colocasia esculenta]